MEKIYNLWNRVGLFLFLFVCLFLFLLLDFFRLLYKSSFVSCINLPPKNLENIAAKIMREVLDLKRQNKCKSLLFCLLTTDMQRLCLLWHYWKTLPFLSTPHVNNATFQRINFVKLKFIWISLNIFKKNKYVIDINIGAYLLFLSIQKE